MNETQIKNNIISQLTVKLRGFEDSHLEISNKLISTYTRTTATEFEAALNAAGQDVTISEEVIKSIEYFLSSEVFSVHVGEKSISIASKDVPRWFKARQAEFTWEHWHDYERMLLEQGRPKEVVTANEEVIDTVLDYSGDPRTLGSWSRKGLVMGNVQSGKTQNYLGLVNKALDCGYKTVILLGGHLNDLRMQTQKRVDEGVLGWESRHHIVASRRRANPIGVGVFNEKNIIPGTTTLGDFKSSTAKLTGTDPVIFCIKKNTSVLKSLIKWIVNEHGVGPDYDNKKLLGPLLLIDDEADYASINTKHHADEITSTNDCIRELLALFARNTYVGYTATPFANIFIDPDENEYSDEDDLFPSDFMVRMPVPDNYVGQDFFFPDRERGDEDDLESLTPGPTVIIDDHLQTGSKKKTEKITALPSSLRSAVRTFVLVTATRAIRGDRYVHNTMLVNTSHLTIHQNQLEKLIEDYVIELKESISSYHALPRDKRNKSPHLLALENTYKSVLGVDDDYELIVTELKKAISKVQVWAVNQSTTNEEARVLDYSKYEDNGLCAIIIGGHKLSRGLTLEGLTVSYFARNSKAYDTLMQMCRWFGYRPGYKDLCRVFLSEESESWYRFVSLSIRELYKELALMAEREASPKEFGLKVREHPGAMIITAKNKIGYGQSETRHQDLWGQIGRRFRFDRDEKTNLENLRITKDLVTDLVASHRGGIETGVEGGTTVFQGVSYSIFIRYLESLNLQEDNIPTASIIKNLKRMEATGAPLPHIALFGKRTSNPLPWEKKLSDEGDREYLNSEFAVNGAIPNILMPKRKMKAKESYFYVPSTNLGNPDDEKIFLSAGARKAIAEPMAPEAPVSFDYLGSDERAFAGLIIYHFATAFEENGTLNLTNGRNPSLGITVSLPRSEKLKHLGAKELKDLVRETKHSYQMNKVALQLQEYGDYNEEDD
jgi:hypothetical protein